jgi:hypothetical protein
LHAAKAPASVVRSSRKTVLFLREMENSVAGNYFLCLSINRLLAKEFVYK